MKTCENMLCKQSINIIRLSGQGQQVCNFPKVGRIHLNSSSLDMYCLDVSEEAKVQTDDV